MGERCLKMIVILRTTVCCCLLMGSLVFGGVGAADTCKQNDEVFKSCQCKTDDGIEINLHQLIQEHGPTIMFKDQKSTLDVDDYLYSYMPCLPFTEGDVPTDCLNVAACQVNPVKKSYFNIGKQESAKFHGDPHDGTLYIEYESATDPSRKTQVYLECSSEAKPVLEVIGEKPELNYVMKLKTSVVCIGSKGLSVGSILLIVFFVFIVVYLVAGVLILRFGRGARGVEQIPNYEFWTELPLLVKDGVMFTVRGCKPESTYEQI